MNTIIFLKNKVWFFHIDMKQHIFDYKTKMNIHFFNFNCYLKKKTDNFFLSSFYKIYILQNENSNIYSFYSISTLYEIKKT